VTSVSSSKTLLLPWLALIFTVLTLLALGGWQLQRLQWKQQLMAQYEAGLGQAPVPLGEFSTEALEDSVYRRMVVEGEFLHDKEVHLGGRRWHGKTGYQVLTPLQIADGRMFLVNRGWIPFEVKDTALRPETIAQHRAEGLNVVIRKPKPANFLMPQNHPEKNFWFYVETSALAEYTGLALEPVVLEAYSDAAPDLQNFPIPSAGERVFRNDHLGYAITWLSLAIAAMVMFYLRAIRPRNAASA